MVACLSNLTRRFFCPLAGALLYWAAAAAASDNVHISLYDFRDFGRSDGIGDFESSAIRTYEVVSRPGEPTRYRKVSTDLNTHQDIRHDGEKWKRPTMLDALERESLVRMLGNYINQDLFDSVFEAKGIWKPAQVRMVVSWVPMTYAEAQTVFKGNIPWRRVLGARAPMNADLAQPWEPTNVARWRPLSPGMPAEPLQIVLASVLLGSGQTINPRGGKLEYAEMAWQKKRELFADISALDERAMPLRTEFSRANAEPGPTLPGDLDLVLHFSFGILETETRQLGFSPEQHFLFARIIRQENPEHRWRAPFMARAFRMRRFDAALKARLESSPDLAAIELSTPSPKADLAGDVVLITSLTHSVRHFGVESISQADYELFRKFGEKIPLPTLRRLRGELFNKLFRYYHFPQYDHLTGPVCVADSTELPAAFFISQLRGAGIKNPRAQLAAIENFVAPPVEYPTPFTNLWAETGVVHQEFSAIRIDNIAEESVRMHGDDLLATILITVWEDYERAVDESMADVREQIFSGFPGQTRTALPDSLDAGEILDQFTFMVVTTSEFVAGRLAKLGGQITPQKATSIFAIDIPEVSTTHWVTQDTPGYVARFRRAAVTGLKRRFPHVAAGENCAGYLRIRGALQSGLTL